MRCIMSMSPPLCILYSVLVPSLLTQLINVERGETGTAHSSKSIRDESTPRKAEKNSHAMIVSMTNSSPAHDQLTQFHSSNLPQLKPSLAAYPSPALSPAPVLHFPGKHSSARELRTRHPTAKRRGRSRPSAEQDI